MRLLGAQKKMIVSIGCSAAPEEPLEGERDHLRGGECAPIDAIPSFEAVARKTAIAVCRRL